jgi:hypothetical protein
LRTPAMMFLLNYSRARSKERRASGCSRRVSHFKCLEFVSAGKMKMRCEELDPRRFFVVTMSRFIEKILAITHSDFRSPTSPLRMLHFLLDFGFY